MGQVERSDTSPVTCGRFAICPVVRALEKAEEGPTPSRSSFQHPSLVLTHISTLVPNSSIQRMGLFDIDCETPRSLRSVDLIPTGPVPVERGLETTSRPDQPPSLSSPSAAGGRDFQGGARLTFCRGNALSALSEKRLIQPDLIFGPRSRTIEQAIGARAYSGKKASSQFRIWQPAGCVAHCLRYWNPVQFRSPSSSVPKAHPYVSPGDPASWVPRQMRA